ncbi:MAG TPA: glycosyltransferase [Candidatus Kapabacteria bacterium]|nr:glycosyltransferase [Candidatus Kapabacteria bacterium]
MNTIQQYPTIDDLSPFIAAIGSVKYATTFHETEDLIGTNDDVRPEILFITSYPPRECGIATYSQDVITALEHKFGSSFSVKICALESGDASYPYPEEVCCVLDTSRASSYQTMVRTINRNPRIAAVMIQHEFGFFAAQEEAFVNAVTEMTAPVIITFHTVLPSPNDSLRANVQRIAAAAESVIVMTHAAAHILVWDYNVDEAKITIIAHGTHLVSHVNKDLLKEKYGLRSRIVLTTFGLLSPGKSIETALEALPSIVKFEPNVMFLVLGKTHPGVVKTDGQTYRMMLEAKVDELKLHDHVTFVNTYLSLEQLLEYLQLTDIYLFTSKDPNQAVSGTFSYAMSCACPIISTPIPHSREVLNEDTGILIDFQNHEQLAAGVIRLLTDESLRNAMSLNALRKISSTAWENSAVAHAMLLAEISGMANPLKYNLPAINMDHMKRLTTGLGMIQFSKVNQPDLNSGYTLDDNARALVAMCMHYESTHDPVDIHYLHTYLNLIRHCLQPDGNFLNYVGTDKTFAPQNNEVNLEDANGRAIWALGYLISKRAILPVEFFTTAETVFRSALTRIPHRYSSRSMAFAIKGLYYYHSVDPSDEITRLIDMLATRLTNMYLHESEPLWSWFESYLTYGNSVLPEAMLYAQVATGKQLYETIAKESFDFLLSQTFNRNGIKVISNRTWLHKGKRAGKFGEQPIDVAYTISALRTFYDFFGDEEYSRKMRIAFDWFLGRNHLHQTMYNPCTGGCYDGLEEQEVNLNQGAESTVSYLMARLTVEPSTSNIH